MSRLNRSKSRLNRSKSRLKQTQAKANPRLNGHLWQGPWSHRHVLLSDTLRTIQALSTAHVLMIRQLSTAHVTIIRELSTAYGHGLFQYRIPPGERVGGYAVRNQMQKTAFPVGFVRLPPTAEHQNARSDPMRQSVLCISLWRTGGIGVLGTYAVTGERGLGIFVHVARAREGSRCICAIRERVLGGFSTHALVGIVFPRRKQAHAPLNRGYPRVPALGTPHASVK
eukprot:81618-Rhodomonas_salina.2